jgi:hypothetical protein
MINKKIRRKKVAVVRRSSETARLNAELTWARATETNAERIATVFIADDVLFVSVNEWTGLGVEDDEEERGKDRTKGKGDGRWQTEGDDDGTHSMAEFEFWTSPVNHARLARALRFVLPLMGQRARVLRVCSGTEVGISRACSCCSIRPEMRYDAVVA